MSQRTGTRALLFLALAAFIVGCSNETSIDGGGETHAPRSSTSPASEGTDPSSGSPSLPPCVPVATPVPLHPGFPPEFQFPAGSVVTSAGETYAGGTYAEGYAPLRLDDARRFFVESVPAAGFQLVLWEQEMIEADGHFRGHGVTGSWIVVNALDCPEAVHFSIGTYPEE